MQNNRIHRPDVSAFTEPLRAFLGAYAEQRGQRPYVESPFYAMLLSVRGGWLVLPTVVLHIMGWTHHACGGAVRTVAVSRCTLHSLYAALLVRTPCTLHSTSAPPSACACAWRCAACGAVYAVRGRALWWLLYSRRDCVSFGPCWGLDCL